MNKPGNGGVPPVEPQPVEVIQIVLLDNGSVQVNGNFKNKVQFLGLLDLAREMMLDSHRNKPSNGIIPIRREIQ